METTTLQVAYIYDEQPIADVEIDLFLVATWYNGAYHLTEEFADVDVDFSDLTSPSDWRDEGELIDDFIHDLDCTCLTCQDTDTTGDATFDDLIYGVYYVDVEDADYENGTLVSSPVLLTLPAYDASTDTYTYDVVMEPKVVYVQNPTTPDKPTTPTTPTTPDDPDEPDEPDVPDVPDVPEEPDEPDIPTVPSIPTIQRDPDDPLLNIPNPNVPTDGREAELPQTGTYAWLILPLACMGSACVLIAGFVLKDKKVKP